MKNQEIHKTLESLEGKKVLVKLFGNNGSVLMNIYGKLEGLEGEINNSEYLIQQKGSDFKLVPDDFNNMRVVGGTIEVDLGNRMMLYITKK
jgi:hypothetical protein